MMSDLKRIGVVVKHTTYGGLKYNLLTHVVNGFSDCETSTWSNTLVISLVI